MTLNTCRNGLAGTPSSSLSNTVPDIRRRHHTTSSTSISNNNVTADLHSDSKYNKGIYV